MMKENLSEDELIEKIEEQVAKNEKLKNEIAIMKKEIKRRERSVSDARDMMEQIKRKMGNNL